jgi:hypothetical protein
MNTNSISVVIPLFNEGENLLKLFEDLSYLNGEFKKKYIKTEFLIINDYSTDNSEYNIFSNLNLYSDLNIKYIKNTKNIGFARSLKVGFDKSTSQYLMCLPGDAEVNVQSITSFNISTYDLIIYERNNLSTRPLIRILLSYTYRLIIACIFCHKIFDTNGIFIVNKNILNKFILESDSFFINAEVIIKSMLYTKNIDKQKFSLFIKPKYKSTSLNWHQFFSVSKGMFKLIIFKLRHIAEINNGN